MNFVLQFLQDNRDRLKLSAFGAPERLTAVLLTPRFRASSHVVFLILPEGQADPVLVAKVPRLRDNRGSLSREAANLQFAEQSLAGRLDSIPRLVAFEEFRGYPILVETALIGQPMDPPFVRRRLKFCCDAVCRWLGDVQPISQASVAGVPDGFDRLVAAPLEYLADAVAWSREDRLRIERTREMVDPLRSISLPTVLEHGDFSHPNLMLLRDGQAGVVDWEMAEPWGLPAHDLVFFLTYAAFARHQVRDNHQYIPAIQSAFFGDDAWAIPYLEAYAIRFQLPPESMIPLFLLCWIRYLAGLLRRLDKDAAKFGDDTADWLRQNRYYHAWSFAIDHVDQLCYSGTLR